MITIDYELDIDMDTEKRTYHPSEEISKGLKNIFKLRGPNSSGKSTFMNLVALGSYGLHQGKVPDAVRERMKHLLESEHRDLEFNITIHDPVTDTVLKSEKVKKYPDIKVSESLDGGKTFNTIAAEQFEKKYNLIYDIPENPVGRLNDLVGEIIDVQENIETNIKRLQNYAEDVSTSISGSRSDEEIERMKIELGQLEEEFKKIDLGSEEAYYKALNGLMIALKLEELRTKSNVAKEALDDFKKTVKKKQKDPDNEYKKDLAALDKKIEQMNLFKLVFVTNANRIQYPRINKLRKMMDTLENDSILYLKQGGISNDIREEVVSAKLFAESLKGSENDQEVKLLSDLIRLLEPHLHKNFEMPEIGSLDEFYKNLTNRFESMNNTYDNRILDGVIVNADKILKAIDDINKIILEIVPPKIDPIASFDESRKGEGLESQYDVASKNLSSYVTEVSGPYGITLANLDVKISEFNLITDQAFANKKYTEVKEAHQSYYDKYHKRKNEKDILEHNILRLRNSISLETSKEKSEFLDCKNDINKLKDEINGLLLTLSNASRMLHAVKQKNYGMNNKNDPFFKSVWKYLGKRLRIIRHEDREYMASEVNLIEGVIIADDGTRISLSDMGTGQSQLSYLKGLLSIDDNRKIIALFDEVSTMSDSTLNILLNEFQILQGKGKLMLGMTVSPAEKIEVEEYGI